jgi:hypothetical protein
VPPSLAGKNETAFMVVWMMAIGLPMGLLTGRADLAPSVATWLATTAAILAAEAVVAVGFGTSGPQVGEGLAAAAGAALGAMLAYPPGLHKPERPT